MKEYYHIKLLNRFLDGESNQQELEELNSCLQHSGQIDEWMNQQWENASYEIPTKVEKKMYGVIDNKCISKHKFRSIILWKVASVALLLLTIGVTVLSLKQGLFEKQLNGKYIVNVERGEKANIILPDGTKVWLNSSTHISYDTNYGEKERLIELEGEAYFEVAQNKEKPFIVHTDQMSVKALGTIFSVSAYKEDQKTSAVLVSGKIEVKTSNNVELLNSNQRLVCDRLSGMTEVYTETDVTGHTAWKKNILVCEDESIESIVKKLARHYNIQFVFEDKRVKQFYFTGTIELSEVKTVLDVLALASPIKYKKRGQSYILSIDANNILYYE